MKLGFIVIEFLVFITYLDHTETTNTEHCCLPEQFNGKLLVVSRFLEDNADNVRQNARFGIDFGKKTLYAHYRDYGQQYPIYWTLIADFEHAKSLYLIDRLSNICWETPIPPKASLINRCIFNSGNHRGAMPFRNRVNAEAYSIPLIRNRESGVHRFLSLILVAKDTCLPIADEGIEIDIRRSRTIAAFFHEMSTSRMSQSLFDVPAICRRRSQRVPRFPFWPVVFLYIQSRFFPVETPKECCVSSQWTATVNKQTFYQSVQGGTSGIQTSVFPRFYMDYTNKRFAGSEEIFVNGVSMYNKTFLADMNNGMTLYSISNDDQCYKFVVPDYKSVTGQCLTPDAVYENTVSLGKAPTEVEVDVWRVVKDTIFGMVPGKVYLTKAHCVPVMITASGRAVYNDLSSTMTITDFEDHITDSDSVFAVPDGCSNPTLIETTIEQIKQIIMSM